MAWVKKELTDESMGLRVSVFRNYMSDCTLNGVSSKNDWLWVPISSGYISLKEAKERGDVIMTVNTLEIGGRKHVTLCPYHEDGNYPWYMAGGNFAYCSDSRFKEINNYPVPIHDRRER